MFELTLRVAWGVFTSSQLMASAQQHSCEGINFIKLLFKQTLLNALNWITSNYSNKYQLNLKLVSILLKFDINTVSMFSRYQLSSGCSGLRNCELEKQRGRKCIGSNHQRIIRIILDRSIIILDRIFDIWWLIGKSFKFWSGL